MKYLIAFIPIIRYTSYKELYPLVSLYLLSRRILIRSLRDA